MLRRVRTEWRAALRNVPHIVDGEPPISETLIELLGAGPIRRAVDARGAVTRPASMLYEEVGLTRDAKGNRVHWVARRIESGFGEGSSGLNFDGATA